MVAPLNGINRKLKMITDKRPKPIFIIKLGLKSFRQSSKMTRFEGIRAKKLFILYFITCFIFNPELEGSKCWGISIKNTFL